MTTDSSIDYRNFSESVAQKLTDAFDQLRSAFGGMIEKHITSRWAEICSAIGAIPLDRPGRRTIYDFACRHQGQLWGFDIKTKDLDSNRYADGGVCAVGNLLNFIANDKGIFMVVELGHTRTTKDLRLRDLSYLRVAPFHLLPADTYRIENLGTGQVRLNHSINTVYDRIAWDRSTAEFFQIFTEIAIKHYERVSRDAQKRVLAMKRFREDSYARFSF